MAVKEELIIEARAETGDAEKGLARVTKAATALSDSEKALSASGVDASDSLDDLGNATKAADKQLEGAADSAKEFSDQVDRAAKEAAAAKAKFTEAGAAAAKVGDNLDSASTEAVKFTDMLRGIGDEADLAAGKFATGLGGASFLKSLGTVAIGFGAVKGAIEMLGDSSEALFRSYGEEGQAVWDETEKSIFAVRGAFAEAVLGGGSVEQMGARLKGIFDGLKTAVDLALTPIRLLSGAFVDNSVQATQASTATTLWKEATANAATIAVSSKTTIDDLTRSYLALTNQTDALKLAQIGQSLAAIRKEQSDVYAAEKAMDEARAQADVAAQAEALARKAYEEDQAPKKRVPIYPGAATFRVIDENLTLEERIRRKMDIALVAAREKQKELTVETRLTLDRLGNLYNDFGRLYAEVGVKVATPITPTGFSGGAASGAAADELVYLQEIGAGYAKITKEQYEAALVAQDMTGDFSVEYLEMRQSEFDEVEDMAQKVADNDATRAAERVAHYAEGARLAAEELHNFQVAEEERLLQEAEKLKKQLDEFWSDFGDSSKALGLQNMQDALAGIGTALGQAAKSGEDFGDAIGATMESLVGQIAGQWGDLFLKQGIGLMFLDPVAGAGLLAAGIGLKALSGFMSGGDSTTDTGTTGASGVQDSATAATTVARPESSFGYFEGGRSPVTIVTNDAASIRTMQHRLDFVSARGGSGV